MNQGDLTAESLREQLSYDPDTGLFCWRVRRRGIRRGRDVAGARKGLGYWHIRINYQLHMAHRLAWLYVNGEWPVGPLDHINGNPGDNRIANLRIATGAENSRNISKHARNTSGLRGVDFRKGMGRWRATIMVDRKKMHLGYFDTAAEAARAYDEAASRLHGEFGRKSDWTHVVADVVA